MERRMYYSAPNLAVAEECHQLAQELNVAEGNFAVVSLNSSELQTRKLPAADYLKSLDLMHCSFHGIAYGFAGGAIILTLMELIKPYSFDIQVQHYWVPMLMTICFGLWLGIMTGIAKTNHHLAPFKHKLKKGGSIIMLDVIESREHEVELMFRQRIPQAKLEKVTDLVETFFEQTG